MTNKELADKFRLIARGLRSTGETNEFRLKAYYVSAAACEQLPEELEALKLREGMEAVMAMCKTRPGLGEKSRKKIFQFLETGTCDELDEVLKKMPQEQLELIPVEKKEKKRKASKNLREEVTATRRPWADADAVVQTILPIVRKHFTTANVCGSYRRGKATVKDIDFALTDVVGVAVEDYTKPGVISQIYQALFVELGVEPTNVIKLGDGQMSFYYGSPSGEWQIDFWVVKPESYGALVLFNTGSADFNVGMRGWCKARGYGLNRYGLFKITGPGPEDKQLVASQTEQSIFDALGLAYVEPKDREVGFKAIPRR